MGVILANNLEKKSMIIIEGQPYVVTDVTFASPSARGASMMVKARVRNLLTGAVLDKTFRTGDKFDEADIEVVPASFLYSDPEGYHFMDDATFEQFFLNFEKLGDLRYYLKEGVPIQAVKYNGAPVSLQLPVYVELKVVYAEPSVRGDSAGSVLKNAELETGMKAKVPIYVKDGDVVRVNTQTGEVSGRA